MMTFYFWHVQQKPAQTLQDIALCGHQDIAEVLVDKYQSWEFSKKHNLPFAPTIRCDVDQDHLGEFCAEHGLPVIAKPISGFGSKGVCLLYEKSQVQNYTGQSQYILQHYIGNKNDPHKFLKSSKENGLPLFHSFEQIKISIQCFITKQGAPLTPFITKNKMKSGRSEAIESYRQEDALELGLRCANVFAKAGWRGPLNIQCQRTPDGDLAIYEYNGRFTGATSARYLMGYDEVGIAIRDFANLSLDMINDKCPVEIVIRTPVSRVTNPENVNKLLNSKIWTRT